MHALAFSPETKRRIITAVFADGRNHILKADPKANIGIRTWGKRPLLIFIEIPQDWPT